MWGVCFKLKIKSVYRHSLQRKRYSALDKWTAALESIHTTVIGKNHSGARGDYGFGLGDGYGPGSDRW